MTTIVCNTSFYFMSIREYKDAKHIFTSSFGYKLKLTHDERRDLCFTVSGYPDVLIDFSYSLGMNRILANSRKHKTNGKNSNSQNVTPD